MISFTSHRGTLNPENAERYRAVCSRLMASGWERLGSGSYAAVFRHPDCPETVLKVGHLDWSRGKADKDGYLNYLRANATLQTQSPHAPKVHAVEVYDHHYYVELEPLEVLSVEDFRSEGLSPFQFGQQTGDVRTPSLKAYLRRTERLRRIAERKNDTRLEPDYHRGNFMRRPGTGELVLTDPWAN